MSGYNAMVRRQAMEAACLGTYGPYKPPISSSTLAVET